MTPMTPMTPMLALHHMGCATRDLDATLASYGRLLGPVRRSPVIEVERQSVRVCFLELAPNTYLELVQGTAPGSPVERYTRTGFYHLCFLVEDLDATVRGLDPRVRPLPAFASEAFGGRRCQFVVTAESHLIELAEMSPSEFAERFARDASPLT